MANPQVEDGYTPIANEILDALIAIRIPGEARQCLDLIIRKTYGFRKKEDWISLSQFVESTGMRKPTVSRALKKLTVMSLIIKKDNGIGVTYGLQKDVSLWIPLSKKTTLKQNPVIKKDNDVIEKDNGVIHNSTSGVLSKKITPIIKKDNQGYSKKIIGGYSKKSTTKSINITKESLQKKATDLDNKIKIIVDNFNNWKTENKDLIIKEAETVFDKKYKVYSITGSGKIVIDKIMDAWIRNQLQKIEDWIIKDKITGVNNFEGLIERWFKREKQYPGQMTAAEEQTHYKSHKRKREKLPSEQSYWNKLTSEEQNEWRRIPHTAEKPKPSIIEFFNEKKGEAYA